MKKKAETYNGEFFLEYLNKNIKKKSTEIDVLIICGNLITAIICTNYKIEIEALDIFAKFSVGIIKGIKAIYRNKKIMNQENVDSKAKGKSGRSKK